MINILVGVILFFAAALLGSILLDIAMEQVDRRITKKARTLDLFRRVEGLEEHRDLNMTSHALLRCPGCDTIVRRDEHVCTERSQS